jgi:hypothetical protein
VKDKIGRFIDKIGRFIDKIGRFKDKIGRFIGKIGQFIDKKSGHTASFTACLVRLHKIRFGLNFGALR